jgi:hypothetical protein
MPTSGIRRAAARLAGCDGEGIGRVVLGRHGPRLSLARRVGVEVRTGAVIDRQSLKNDLQTPTQGWRARGDGMRVKISPALGRHSFNSAREYACYSGSPRHNECCRKLVLTDRCSQQNVI